MKKQSLYREALSASFLFSWKQKKLWVFGLLAAMLGQMGMAEFIVKVLKIGSTNSTAKILLFPTFVRSGDWNLFVPVDVKIWAITLGLLLFGIFVFLVFAAVSSQGAIIHSVAKSVKKNKLPKMGESWHIGVHHAGRLFFINMIKKITLFIASLLIGISIFALVINFSFISFFLYLVLFVVAAIISLSVTIISIYAAGYVVVEQYKFVEAVQSAWKLFTSHWLVSIEVGIIVLFAEIAMVIFAIWGVAILFLPTMIIWFMSVLSLNSALWIAGTTIATILSSIFVMLLGSFFTVFTTSVWTYLFMKMHKVGIVSTIAHTFRK
jgi:hypothetical protein